MSQNLVTVGFISLALFSSCAVASDSLADLANKVAKRSQITFPGSRPFVLKAKVLDSTNPANTNYTAEIEEYWVAPDKWRRVVKTPSFSETLTVNGGKTSYSVPSSFDAYDMYFKAGDYNQSASSSTANGAKVKFYSLAVSHS